MQIPTDHIRPCPFCGNPKPTDRFAIYHERTEFVHSYSSNKTTEVTYPAREEHAIGCGVCQVQMPYKSTREEAIYMWNMRPDDWNIYREEMKCS